MRNYLMAISDFERSARDHRCHCAESLTPFGVMRRLRLYVRSFGPGPGRSSMSASAGSKPQQNAPRARGGRWSTFAAIAALAVAFDSAAHGSTPSSVTVDVYDRTQGETLAIHPLDAQRYVVGTPGHEYAIRIRNESGRRILAVTSVDGVNVVTGETAAPEQSGYVIEAGGSVEIAGWRRSLERTSAFYFTDLGDSYAARTGRPRDVGVIGVAVFHEVPRPSVSELLRDKIVAHENAQRARAEGAEPMSARPERAEAASPAPSQDAAASAGIGRLAAKEARPLSQKLGTGFGRDETSFVQRVRFERATVSPAETVSILYDRRDNLIAMGVLPSPRYAGRTPDPFPAMRFVPAPR